jgi:biotin carboxyl carrier protein
MAAARLRGVAGTVERELTVADHGDVTIAGAAYRVAPLGPGAWRVSSDHASASVYVVRHRNGFWVHVDGRVYVVEVARAGAAARRTTSVREHALAAPMPATVLSVVANVGQTVSAGETVLILEAMKMELPVRAPRDGIVSAIHCREGELVQPGVTLVEIA